MKKSIVALMSAVGLLVMLTTGSHAVRAQTYGVPAQAPNDETDRLIMPGTLSMQDVLAALGDEPAVKGYRPRKSHPVSAVDLAACADAVGVGVNIASSSKGASQRSLQLVMEFDNNSIGISPRSAADLETLAQGLDHPQLRQVLILIEGHANRVSAHDPPAPNRRLSCERAAKVRETLRLKHHVAAERMQAVGYGYSLPLPAIDISDSRNRRVVIRRLQ